MLRDFARRREDPRRWVRLDIACSSGGEKDVACMGHL
jgi:hypothetical protein